MLSEKMLPISLSVSSVNSCGALGRNKCLSLNEVPVNQTVGAWLVALPQLLLCQGKVQQDDQLSYVQS